MNRTTIDHLAALLALVVVVYLLTRDTATDPAAAAMPNPNQLPDHEVDEVTRERWKTREGAEQPHRDRRRAV